jgi:hypothetical protein
MAKSRKDNKGRVLRKGETQRSCDGKYVYTYVDPEGKRRSIYSKDIMETGFKRKIFDASQAVNGFTEKILAQKAVVKDIEADVKRLGDAYRIALKRNPLSANSKLEEYNAARKALDEEKAALFGLTQQQAEARLSVKKLRDEYALYKDDAKEVVETNNGIAISWKKALAVIGGTGVLIVVGVAIETCKQLESSLINRNYKGAR